MVLNCEHWQTLVFQSLNRPVVQIEVGDLEFGCPRNSGRVLFVRGNGEAVVLRRYQHPAGGKVFDRVIPAPMAVRKLLGRPTEAEGDELVPETDAENGD